MAASMRSPEVAGLAAAGGVAVLPIGAVEQHGPHLPIDTDSVIATALAERAVTLAGGIDGAPPLWLLPTLSYGLSPEHAGRPGTVSLSSTTLLAICLDLGRAIAASGIATLIFVNAHGGNPDLLRVAARDIRADSGVTTYVVHAPVLPLPDGLVAAQPRPELDVHAGFYETSVMLALDPASVHLPSAAPDGLAVAGALDGLLHVSLFGEISLPWHSDDLSASGVIGDPTGASAEWGAKALAVQAQSLAEAIVELAGFSYPAPGGAA
ncbi:creatininase family protein [Herbiconiux moechotypicola]|uniref:Creatininase family protein n=1 Tax=Herbiconiux moechotypicola TaxID=637393 RepID=A0ABN3DI53_9MICO|nr:creatininase family protein [Herbiconiux moechotypicola]MCS5729633.1 creatininase family protein [Herbiconiux moechotypicola]